MMHIFKIKQRQVSKLGTNSLDILMEKGGG